VTNLELNYAPKKGVVVAPIDSDDGPVYLSYTNVSISVHPDVLNRQMADYYVAAMLWWQFRSHFENLTFEWDTLLVEDWEVDDVFGYHIWRVIENQKETEFLSRTGVGTFLIYGDPYADGPPSQPIGEVHLTN
jgi:hypothetical protein